jgi:hypothetical protein
MHWSGAVLLGRGSRHVDGRGCSLLDAWRLFRVVHWCLGPPEHLSSQPYGVLECLGRSLRVVELEMMAMEWLCSRADLH